MITLLFFFKNSLEKSSLCAFYFLCYRKFKTLNILLVVCFSNYVSIKWFFMFYLFVDVIFFIYCLTTGCPSPPFVFFIYLLFRDLYIIISFFYMVSVVFLYRFLYQVVSVRSSVTIFVIVVFYKKRRSWQFHKIHKKTPMPESLFK